MAFLKKIGNFVWSKHFLINVLAIALVYVIGIWGFRSCLSANTNHGIQVEVPNLIGKNQNMLESIFEGSDLGFVVLDSIYDPTKVEGTILEQDPSPSEKSNVYVKPGRVVKVRVSKRTQLVEMPSLVDKSQRFAEKILVNRGFRYRLDYKPSREAHGAVIEQRYKGKPISGGAKLPIGSRIELIVGRNESGEPVPIPDLYGLSINEAKARVMAMGNMEFYAVCPTCVTASDSLVARVQTQSPEYSEGGLVATGSTITVFAVKEFDGVIPE